MSKREEIKRKEQLQLQLQAQFNKMDQTVLSWLKPKNSISKAQDPLKQKGIEQFSDTVVIPIGKGLNMDSKEPVQVGQFMNSTTNKEDNKTDIKKSQIQSKSLQALQNKIRNDQRSRGVSKMKEKPQNKYKKSGTADSNSYESESDDEILVTKSKKTNKIKRPF